MSMVTETVPGVAMSEAETGAVSWLALTNVVVSWVVFHRMIAPETKPVLSGVASIFGLQVDSNGHTFSGWLAVSV